MLVVNDCSGAWLEVPAKAPEVISNKIYYTTALGKTEYDFTVIIPDVQIKGLYNEMALPGSLAKVSGADDCAQEFEIVSVHCICACG